MEDEEHENVKMANDDRLHKFLENGIFLLKSIFVFESKYDTLPTDKTKLKLQKIGHFILLVLCGISISLFVSSMPSCDQIAHKLGYERITPETKQYENQISNSITSNAQQPQRHNDSHYIPNTTNYQTTNYQKENDFMVAVLNNPSFNLYEFITVAGLHERNTQFLTESQYQATNYIKNKCSEMNITNFHIVYVKVHKAWNIFKEVQDTDVSFDGMGKYFYKYSMWDVTKPTSCPYPELKHKLSIVPLRLQ